MSAFAPYDNWLTFPLSVIAMLGGNITSFTVYVFQLNLLHIRDNHTNHDRCHDLHEISIALVTTVVFWWADFIIPLIRLLFRFYNDIIMSAMASQLTSLMIVYSTVYSRRRSNNASKFPVTGLGEGNYPVTGEFPAQMASNAESVSIWWRHHV